jgi:hypothetical protein
MCRCEFCQRAVFATQVVGRLKRNLCVAHLASKLGEVRPQAASKIDEIRRGSARQRLRPGAFMSDGSNNQIAP